MSYKKYERKIRRERNSDKLFDITNDAMKDTAIDLMQYNMLVALAASRRLTILSKELSKQKVYKVLGGV